MVTVVNKPLGDPPSDLHLLEFKALCNSSHWVGTGPGTCFQSAEHGKGYGMSRPWLHYVVRLELETPLAGSEEVSCRAGRRHVAKSCGQPLDNSQRETGISVLQLQGDQFHQQPEGAWKQVFSWSSLWWGHRLSQHLECSRMRTQISNRKCEIINGCCFELPSLWQYITEHRKLVTVAGEEDIAASGSEQASQLVARYRPRTTRSSQTPESSRWPAMRVLCHWEQGPLWHREVDIPRKMAAPSELMGV